MSSLLVRVAAVSLGIGIGVLVGIRLYCPAFDFEAGRAQLGGDFSCFAG